MTAPITRSMAAMRPSEINVLLSVTAPNFLEGEAMRRRLPIVIIVAPPGAGKSTHAQALMRRFGCTHLLDDDEWDGREQLRPGTLALTNLSIAELLKEPESEGA